METRHIFSPECLIYLNNNQQLKSEVLNILISILSKPELTPQKNFHLNGGSSLSGSIESFENDRFSIVDIKGLTTFLNIKDIKEIQDIKEFYEEFVSNTLVMKKYLNIKEL